MLAFFFLPRFYRFIYNIKQFFCFGRTTLHTFQINYIWVCCYAVYSHSEKSALVFGLFISICLFNFNAIDIICCRNIFFFFGLLHFSLSFIFNENVMPNNIYSLVSFFVCFCYSFFIHSVCTHLDQKQSGKGHI